MLINNTQRFSVTPRLYILIEFSRQTQTKLYKYEQMSTFQ